MADKQYRTVTGVIQFDPKDGDANGKPVRNITVQQAGFGPTAVRVSATVWPSHSHIELRKGTVVAIEGEYRPNKSQKEDGTPVTYHNLSVSRLAVLGQVDEGNRDSVATVNTGADDDVNDDDIPF